MLFRRERLATVVFRRGAVNLSVLSALASPLVIIW